MRKWSTACSPRRITASAGRRSGWTWSAMPIPTASNWITTARTPGAIAITSSSAFNRDKPYDRFIKEQIAGDEMFPGSKEALIATGYLRAGSEHLVSGNIDPEESRQEVLTEIATNVGQTFLGHDGQLRALPQSQVRSHSAGRFLPPAGDFRRRERQGSRDRHAAKKESLGKRRRRLTRSGWTPVENGPEGARQTVRASRSRKSASAKLDPKLLEALNTPKDKRTPEQKTPGLRTPRRRSSRPGTRWSR